MARINHDGGGRGSREGEKGLLFILIILFILISYSFICSFYLPL